MKELFSNSTAATAWRFSIYTFGFLLLAASLPWVAEYRGAAAFKENGAIEWLQLGFLVAMSMIFLREAFLSRRFHQAFVLLACIAAAAAVREMDANLERIIPWLGWKIGYAFILYAGYVGYANRQILGHQVTRCLNSRAFALLWAGFMFAWPFAQLVGHGAFMRAIMGDDYSRDYQRMIEEIGEVMGYGLLLIGSFELILETRKTATGDESTLTDNSSNSDV